MRVFRVMAAIGILAAAPACDKASPSGPSETTTFTAQLSPANEVPAVTNAEAGGSGIAAVTITVNRDSAGAITSASSTVQVNLTGFPPATTITAAHLHRGAAGTNGGIVLDVSLSAGDFTLNAGAGGFSRTGLSLSASLAQEMLTSPSGFYLNVHSLLNSDGMARGQVAPQ